MSKVANKAEKVTIEEDRSTKIFENAPKLFSKWSYDDIKVPLLTLRSRIHASSTTSPPRLSSPKSSSLTPQADTKPKSSEKHSAPLSKDSSARCNFTAETLVRKWRLSASSDTLSKSFTCSPAETPSKCSLVQSCRQVPEKIRPESVLGVSWESRLLTCLPWEEWTRPSTWSLRELESTLSSRSRLLLSALPTKLSMLRKATSSQATPWRRKNKSKKWQRATVDCCLSYILIFKIINRSTLILHSPSD